MRLIKKWQIATRKDGDLITQLLLDRGYLSQVTQELFLNPPAPGNILEDASYTGLAREYFNQAAALIHKYISDDRPIVIHGDYDVDGLCATAILWKTIYRDLSYKNCQPFIPSRFDHGYGLSRESVDTILNSQLTTRFAGASARQAHNPLRRSLSEASSQLLITVDCGITAAEAVEYAKEKGFEVLVVDHHAKPSKLPQCPILWSEKMCAAGLAWVFSQALLHPPGVKRGHPTGEYVELAALATIADLQPLTGFNRSLVKFGLEEINQTKNVGLKMLI